MTANERETSNLILLLKRLVDADFLLAEETAPLLADAEALRRSLNDEDPGATHRYRERLTQAAETLARTDLAGSLYGGTLVEAVHRIAADAGEGAT